MINISRISTPISLISSTIGNMRGANSLLLTLPTSISRLLPYILLVLVPMNTIIILSLTFNLQAISYHLRLSSGPHPLL